MENKVKSTTDVMSVKYYKDSAIFLLILDVIFSIVAIFILIGSSIKMKNDIKLLIILLIQLPFIPAALVYLVSFFKVKYTLGGFEIFEGKLTRTKQIFILSAFLFTFETEGGKKTLRTPYMFSKGPTLLRFKLKENRNNEATFAYNKKTNKLLLISIKKKKKLK